MQENHRIANLSIPKKSCPELYAELAGLTNRVRTERLRTLAAIGLYALNMQTSMAKGSDDGLTTALQEQRAKSAAPPQATALAQHKQVLKNKLFDSM